MRIFVDAGHGGADPGALGVEGPEKAYTQSQAHVFASVACRHGHELRLSRDRDVFVSLAERVRKANAWPAELFLSFHFNSATSPGASGTLVLYHRNSERGRVVAEAVCDEVAPLDGEDDRYERAVGLPDADFRKTPAGNPFVPYVIRATRMPAILVETEFGTDPGAARLLASIDYQVEVAEATLRGIERTL